MLSLWCQKIVKTATFFFRAKGKPKKDNVFSVQTENNRKWHKKNKNCQGCFKTVFSIWTTATGHINRQDFTIGSILNDSIQQWKFFPRETRLYHTMQTSGISFVLQRRKQENRNGSRCRSSFLLKLILSKALHTQDTVCFGKGKGWIGERVRVHSKLCLLQRFS